MKAARLVAYGDVDKFTIEDIATPVPGKGEVLIKVEAAGLNHVETYLRQGYLAQMMPIELPATLGVDAAGTVAAVGEGVTSFAHGDRVIARLPINGKGSQAGYAVATLNQLAKLPATVSFAQGATLPLVALTGRQGIDALGVKVGDRVLVTGALGNVGRAAVQYLKELGAVPVAGVLASQVDDAKALAGEALVPGESSAKGSFAAALDTVGGPVAGMAIDMVRDGGKLAAIAGVPDGANADGRITVINIMGGEDAAMLQKIADAAGRGELTIPVAKTFPLAEVGAAYALLASRGEGKIVLVP